MTCRLIEHHFPAGFVTLLHHEVFALFFDDACDGDMGWPLFSARFCLKWFIHNLIDLPNSYTVLCNMARLVPKAAPI